MFGDCTDLNFLFIFTWMLPGNECASVCTFNKLTNVNASATANVILLSSNIG